VGEVTGTPVTARDIRGSRHPLGLRAVEIRAVEGEELLATAFALRAYAFEPSPRKQDAERQRRALGYLAGSRVLVAFDGATPLVTATAVPMTQAVRGAVLPMSAIAAVASHPAARRQGVARDLVGRLLAEAAQAGAAVSCLYPFRESFYGRLGYVGLPQLRIASVDPRALAPLLSADLGGTVDLLPVAEGYPEYRALLARLQPGVHGMALRGEPNASRLREADLWVALARDGGGVVRAGLTYSISAWRGELRADGFFADSVTGRYLLLQWLARHVDQVRTAVLTLPPGTLVENWLYDLEAAVTSRTDFVTPMARVLSVPGLAGIGCGTGAVAVRVTDPLCPWNEGVFTLAGDGGTLAVTPGGQPEATLAVQGLSALVYGGYDPAELAVRGWGEVPDGVQERLRALFPPTALPYLYEEF
jgi:predicted acetyltransferase